MSRRQADKKTTEPMVVTTLRVPRATLERFGEIAATRHRSSAGELRWLMDRHIEDHSEQMEDAS